MIRDTEEFVLDIRRAARLEGQPVVTTDSELLDPVGLAKTISRAALWLTPAIVRSYDPLNFADWAEADRHELDQAVAAFRSIAAAVPGNAAPTRSQFQSGHDAFQRLKRAVAGPVLREWQASSNELICRIENWANGAGMSCRRKRREVEESLLGKYELHQLIVTAEDEHYVCSPIARFTANAAGSFELSIQPSVQPSIPVSTIYRSLDEQWYIRLARHSGGGFDEVLFEQPAFHRSIEELKALQ